MTTINLGPCGCCGTVGQYCLVLDVDIYDSDGTQNTESTYYKNMLAKVIEADTGDTVCTRDYQISDWRDINVGTENNATVYDPVDEWEEYTTVPNDPTMSSDDDHIYAGNYPFISGDVVVAGQDPDNPSLGWIKNSEGKWCVFNVDVYFKIKFEVSANEKYCWEGHYIDSEDNSNKIGRIKSAFDAQTFCTTTDCDEEEE